MTAVRGIIGQRPILTSVRRLQQAYKDKITVLTVWSCRAAPISGGAAQTLAQDYDLVLGSVH